MKNEQQKRTHRVLLFCCALCLLVANLLCACGLPQQGGSDTTGGGADQSQASADSGTADSGEGNAPLVLTRDGAARVCVVFGHGDNDASSLATKLCQDLASKTRDAVTFPKVNSNVYESRIEQYDYAIVIGSIRGISDELYPSALRAKDSAVVRADKRIVLAGYTAEALSIARTLLVEQLKWKDGTLYLDPSVLGKIRVGNYDVGALTVKGTPLSDYTVLCNAETRPAATSLRELMNAYGGYLLNVTTNKESAGDRRLVVEATAARGSYGIRADGNDLRFVYDGTDTSFAKLLATVETKLKSVSYGTTYKMENLIMEHQKEDTVKVLSFNVYNSYGDPGERDDLAADLILSELPDFFGLQEFDAAYRKGGTTNFSTMISDRYAEAVPAGVPACNIWNPIFYRKDLYTVVASGAVDLYETLGKDYSAEYPYTRGSTDGRTHCRTLIWAVLQDKTSGQQYLIGNFHYGVHTTSKEGDPVSDQAKESALVIEKFKEVSAQYPDALTVICGDYNSSAVVYNTKGCGAWNMLQNGFKDTWALAETKTDNSGSHQLGEAPTGAYRSALDHIFTLSELNVSSYITLVTNEMIRCSDHCPVFVEFARPSAND